MRKYKQVSLLAVMLAAFLMGGTATAASRCGDKVQLPDRPQVNKYSDYSKFIADMVTFKNLKRQSILQQHKCPQLYQSQPNVTPPETLHSALNSAQQGAGKNDSPQTNPNKLPGLSSGALASTNIPTPLGPYHGDESPQQLPGSSTKLISAIKSGDSEYKPAKNFLQSQSNLQEQNTNDAFQLVFGGSMIDHQLAYVGNLNIMTDSDGNIVSITGTVMSESCLSSGCPASELDGGIPPLYVQVQ